jgi:hypothetical protein
MKNNISIITFLMAFVAAGTVQAQIKVNPKIGVNASAVDAKIQDITAEARYGWNAGIDLRMGEGAFFFKPGLHYYNFTANLFQDVTAPGDVPMKDETTIQSLKLPVNAGLRLTGEGGLLGVNVHGGVTPSYILGVKEGTSVPFVKDDLKPFTLGANLGLGIDVLFFTVEANYEMGLTPFFNGAEGKNNVFSVSAGIKF